MVAGLALAPVSRPVMAATFSQGPMQAMGDEMAPSEMPAPEMSDAAAMEQMAVDMPCCPTKTPVPIDCDKCAYMAACGAIYFTGSSAAVVHPFPIPSDAVALHRNDSRPDGLGHPPPEHPPRSLV